MRLVAVSIVKNEADIIEAFVRHTRAWVDHHLIFDHDSTDGTREILGALQAEGLPVTLYRDDAPGHLQQFRSNHLTRLAAQDLGADWVLPLDADEFLAAPDRAVLEQALAASGEDQPTSLPLLDYCATTGDDATVVNPVLRLRHCRPALSTTRKIFLPRSLAGDPTVTTGKGSHALSRGNQPVPDRPLPTGYHLGHFALRSPQQQVVRVLRAELQRLSRGRATAGLDVHYRLGYQLLEEDPALFFATVCPPAKDLSLQPIVYRGGALRYTAADDWSRAARALLPYFEQLALSHGRLADLAGFDIAAPGKTDPVIRELTATGRPAGVAPTLAFSGFTAREGWGPSEGPVPEAFLPAFHWGYAPVTTLTISSPGERAAQLVAEALTYTENQRITVELNGAPVAEHAFGRTNQKETITASLSLRAGDNQLALRYAGSLRSAHDPRALAAIFLSLRVTAG